jgi:hypothetical protein
MSTNTLVDVKSGDTIVKSFWNEIHNALQDDFVGRNSSGAPTSGKRLGTPAVPWGNTYVGSLYVAGVEIDFSGIGANRYGINSSRVRTTSNQPQFLDPAGGSGGLSFDLQATATDLELIISGTGVTISSDITKSGLTAAPGSNNTASLNMPVAADQEATRTFGEDGDQYPALVIDSAGSEITSLVGTWAAFKVNNGSGDEYFIAYIKSSTELTHCKRGYFYDSSGAPVNRIVISDNDTLTLLKLAWVFVDSDGTTVDVTYTAPIYSAIEPGSPATDDYWFDMVNNTWKKYNGSSYVTVTRTFVGWVANDSSDCVAARSRDYLKTWDDFNEIEITRDSNSVIKGLNVGQSLSISGATLTYLTSQPTWDMASNLAGSADLYDNSEQSSRFYFAYISDEGEEIISDISPYNRPELQGYYHPHNPWRCVGFFYNDGSSDIDENAVHSAKYRPNVVDPRNFDYVLNMQIFS